MKKILLSCYACEPGKGSEPAAGWNWAIEMCKVYDVTVVTRANNRDVIETELEKRTEKGSSGFKVIYYDLPSWVLSLKRRGLLSTSGYYLLWQWSVRKYVLERDYDLIHHVTFNSFLCPGFWKGQSRHLILGPLGGGMCVDPAYYRLFGKGGLGQRVRKLVTQSVFYLPWVNSIYKRADKILCANRETYDLLEKQFGSKVAMHLDAGVQEPRDGSGERNEPGRICSFVVVGNIIPRKGWRIALDAMQFLVQAGKANGMALQFVGSGDEFEKAKNLTIAMGLEKHVVWHGKIAHYNVAKVMSDADVLLFPSVRDTSGYVVLEAMSVGNPVICIDHQGGREMTTDETAIRVPVGTYEDTVKKIGEAMFELAHDADRRCEMGKAGKKRIRQVFTWSVKGEFMRDLYEKVLKGVEA